MSVYFIYTATKQLYSILGLIGVKSISHKIDVFYKENSALLTCIIRATINRKYDQMKAQVSYEIG